MTRYRFANVRCPRCGQITRIVDNATGEATELATHAPYCPVARSQKK